MKTIADRVDQFGNTVKSRLAPAFDQIGVVYPPKRITLIGLKAEEKLQVWVSGTDKKWKHLKTYSILGMSGKLGPKLQEGDMQVPEGIYGLESLNPNSLYHLALRVAYPNADDVRRGKADGCSALGGDIMIHGKDCSIGCLAMGDEAAEDLFVLAAQTGIDNVTVILSPVDFRLRDLPKDMPTTPIWTQDLYEAIRHELKTYESQQGSGELGLRYGLDEAEIAGIRESIAGAFGGRGEVFRLRPGGFQADLHYRIWICDAVS